MNRRAQVVLITVGAVALYALMRFLPTGTNLAHADFQAGAGAIEMCDPANPQFLPVVAVKSPVSVEIENARTENGIVSARLLMRTATGKNIGDNDLLVSHTRKLHLLIIDPSLQDYQHVHPVFERDGVGKGEGAWVFSFKPKFGGVYRIFCDFVPAATSRGLYASADLPLAGSPNASWLPGQQKTFFLNGDVVAGKQTTLTLSSANDIKLEPVMDAYAHLVAFDLVRSGFAHLHPDDKGLGKLPLTFKVTVPRAGPYVVWAQMRIDGEDVYVPFKLDVRG